MAFRNENVALRAKVQQLQEELESLRGHGTSEDETPALPALDTAEVTRARLSSSGDLAEMVARREASEADAQRALELARERARKEEAARHAERPRRVYVQRSGGRTRLHIDQKLMRDAIREEAEWHFWFFLINPGIFIVGGLAAWLIGVLELGVGTGVVLALVSWVVALAVGNIIKARMLNPRHTLDLQEGGHFALYAGRSKRPKIYGRLGQLAVRISDHDDASLGWVRIGDGRGSVELNALSPEDVATLSLFLGRYRS